MSAVSKVGWLACVGTTGAPAAAGSSAGGGGGELAQLESVLRAKDDQISKQDKQIQDLLKLVEEKGLLKT